MRLFATACNSAGDAFVVGDSSAIYRRMGNSTHVQIQHHEESNVYPNPVNSELYFSAKINGEVKVFNSLGALVITQRISQSYLDMSSLIKGQYIVEFKTKNSPKMKYIKVVKVD